MRSSTVFAVLLSCSLFFAAAVAQPTSAAKQDPFLGKWSLDPKLSRYAVGLCPKSMVIEMSAAGEGVHYHSLTVMANGKQFTADYTANYDERPVMVTGAHGVLLPVALKRLKPKVVEATYRSGDEVRATSRRVVSADDNLMTITTTSKDGAGNAVTNVSVYHRADPLLAKGFALSRAKDDLSH